MKFVILFAALAVLIAVVSCEDCQHKHDCVVTKCIAGYGIECNHDDECVCTTGHNGHHCKIVSDCHGTCPTGSSHHCVNGGCHCGA